MATPSIEYPYFFYLSGYYGGQYLRLSLGQAGVRFFDGERFVSNSFEHSIRVFLLQVDI